ncbi:MAG: hypothetical protein JNL28_09895 [Planctomycetes bacterium]|nr:hypothetical protein [Planctomycetota bacterium]
MHAGDAPIAAWRTDLLELAFRSASALPNKPHAKTRARLQESVVSTCLELEQPRRALSYIDAIDNWRRGSSYAELGIFYATRGKYDQAQSYLRLAQSIAEHSDAAETQDWQAARIRAMIDEASTLAHPMVSGQDFDNRLSSLDHDIAVGEFEGVRAALQGYAQLHQQHYTNAARRELLEERIHSGWQKTPIQIRFEVQLELSANALAHANADAALTLAGDARKLIDSVTWTPEDRISLVARSARAFHRCGDGARAQAEFRAALDTYAAEETRIVDIYRADALRALAEAGQELGDTPSALELYKRAALAGVTNPNSRPRAEDLTATCRSLAKTGVEPDSELIERLMRTESELSAPW